METSIYALVDIVAASVAALSGALAAQQRKLDLFGVFTIAYVTACAGGIFRDLCLGSVPPVGLSDWRYIACALAASATAVAFSRVMERMRNPVLFFDAVGLGFYAVVGAQKALLLGHNASAAIILGTATAVGGGVMRDVLLNRVPAILQKEIYALPAMAAAGTQVLGRALGWPILVAPWFGASICIAIRLASLRYGWQLRLRSRG